MQGKTTAGGVLQKPPGTGWTAGVPSTQTLSGDGYAEFQVTGTTRSLMFGLGNGDTSQNYTDIECAVYTYAAKALLLIYKGGVGKGSRGRTRSETG